MFQMKERVRRQDVIRVGARLFLTVNNLRGIFNLFLVCTVLILQ